MFDLPENKEIAKLATTIYENGGIVGAVCHGPIGKMQAYNDSFHQVSRDLVKSSVYLY